MSPPTKENTNIHDNHDNNNLDDIDQENDDNIPLTKEREDYLNSAAIAKLLALDQAEQNAAYDGNNNKRNNSDFYYNGKNGVSDDRDESYEEESEDDYDPNQKKKSKKKKPKKNEEKKITAKRGRKRKNAESEGLNYDDDNQPSISISNITKIKKRSSESEETAITTTTTTTTSEVTVPLSSTEKSKKPKKPLPPGMNGGIYTDEEEVLFLEGLNLYGRNWQSLAKHMGTRESHSVRSHAQKHFIKLYRDNLPLPDKVKESGEGFTLSGKPLDPNSAAAKPYLNRAGLTTTESITEKVESIKITSSEPNQSSSNDNNDESSSSISSVNGSILKSSKSENTQPKPKKTKVSNKQKTKKDTTEKKPYEPITTTYEENGRTSYASSRLRSQPKPNNTYEVMMATNSDPLTLVECVPFDNVDKGDGAVLQPFSLQVYTNVSLVMDFHSHLKSTEIIGLLAGSLDISKQCIIVKEAYPCKSLNTGRNEVNVEVDPASAFEVRQMIEQNGMTVVGWYHSHPTFLPDPSFVDIDNQYNYQKLSKDTFSITPTTTEIKPSSPTDDASTDNHHSHNHPLLSTENSIKLEPFVGAIVTPYDPEQKTPISAINWFYITEDGPNSCKTARSLNYEIIESKCLSKDEESRMLALITDYKISTEKTDFKEIWRSISTENKLSKLIRTLASRMPWLKKLLMDKVNNIKNSETTADIKGEVIESSNEDKEADTIMKDDIQTIQKMDIDEDKMNNLTDENTIIDNIINLDQFLQSTKLLLESW